MPTATLLKMSDNTFWHGNSSFYVTRGGVKYGLIDSMAEICAGTADLGSVSPTYVEGSPNKYSQNLTNSYDIAFPMTFSKVPHVIISLANLDNGSRYGGVKPFVLNSGSEITKKGFKVRVANYCHVARAVSINYIAIRPFQDLAETASSKTSAKKTKGSWKAPTAISTGTAIKMTDNNYWSLQAVHDNRTTSSTLHDTYCTFDCGTISQADLAGNSNRKETITFNKVFAEPPIIIACLTNGGWAGNHGRGLINCSAKSTGNQSATLYIYNASGNTSINPHAGSSTGRPSITVVPSTTCPSVGANWIAFGKAEI